MIGFLPEIYPDELFYSWIARYHLRSGYDSYIYTSEDIYENKYGRPDAEFINGLRSDVIEIIQRNFMSMEQLVNEHTMFPAYGRFVEKHRRKEALKSLIEINGNYHNLMQIAQRKDGSMRYLRYCKHCVVEDREEYGETYWHRCHQIVGLNVCPKHKCYLNNSHVVLSGKASPSLIAANSIVDGVDEITECRNNIELELGAYMVNTFLSPVDMRTDIPIGEFLHSRLENGKYVKESGAVRKMSAIYGSYQNYYAGLDNTFKLDITQMQKIFNGYRFNFHEVCQLALLVGVPYTELVKVDMSDQKLGVNIIYVQVAEQLGYDYDTVKHIGDEVLRIYRSSKRIQRKSGPQRKAWDKLDVELLPKVKQIALEIYGDGNSRPHRVTVAAVSKRLSVPNKRFDLLPMCKNEILEYHESQEQYWAREVAWVVRQLQKDETELCWKRIREQTNMRKVNLQSCLPYLKQLISEERYNEICMML